MEQRDYIIREIEKISILILGLIGRLKRIETLKMFEYERGLILDEFESSTGINIDSVIHTETGDIKKLFTREKGFDYRNMELMADLLFEFSNVMQGRERTLSIEKAIFLLELVDSEGKVFSYERRIKLDELKSLL